MGCVTEYTPAKTRVIFPSDILRCSQSKVKVRMAEQFAYVTGPEYTNKIPSLLFLTVLFDAMFKYTSSLRDFAWFNFNVQQF